MPISARSADTAPNCVSCGVPVGGFRFGSFSFGSLTDAAPTEKIVDKNV
jgi:hypothetical protein